MRILMVFLVIALIGGQQLIRGQAAQDTLKFGAIESKILSGPDSDGDVWFSLKIEARNEDDKERFVDITIRGLDADGFEVVEVQIKGKVKAGQKRMLTESTYVNAETYKSIVKWEVED